MSGVLFDLSLPTANTVVHSYLLKQYWSVIHRSNALCHYGNRFIRTVCFHCLFITARSSYASAVLGIVIRSVCPSVRLSHMLFGETKEHTAYILKPMKGNHCSFLIPTEVHERCHLLPEICASSDPPL